MDLAELLRNGYGVLRVGDVAEGRIYQWQRAGLLVRVLPGTYTAPNRG